MCVPVHGEGQSFKCIYVYLEKSEVEKKKFLVMLTLSLFYRKFENSYPDKYVSRFEYAI